MSKESKKIKRKLQGTVVSDKMQKSVVVKIDYMKQHPRYLKYYKVSKRFKAHDEKNEYNVGDRVEIEETRPLSKTKRYYVTRRIISKSSG